MPAARGAGRGRSAGRPAAPGSRLPARRPGSGPAPVTVAALALPAPRPQPYGPVPPAARPPRRLLRPQLRGRLLHLPRLDRGVQTAGDGGHGGARRYAGGWHGVGGRGVPATGARRREALSAAPGGSSRAALPRAPGRGRLFIQKRPWEAQARRGPGRLQEHPPAPRRHCRWHPPAAPPAQPPRDSVLPARPPGCHPPLAPLPWGLGEAEEE